MYEIAKEASQDPNLMVSFLVGEYGDHWMPTDFSSPSSIDVWPLPGGGDTMFTVTSYDSTTLPAALRNVISSQFRVRMFTRHWDPFWLNVTAHHCNAHMCSFPIVCSSSFMFMVYA
jgi:hypothetical protein